MVRFSCFNTHIGSQKPKKTVQPSVEAMHMTFDDFSQVQAPKDTIKATSMESFLPEAETTAEIHDRVKPVTDSSHYHNWKSFEIKDKTNLDCGSRSLQNLQYLKKSLSHGSGLCLEGRVPQQIDTDDETDQGYSSDSHDHGLVEDGRKHTVMSQNAPCSDSVQVSSNHVNIEPVFSIGDHQFSEKDGHDFSNFPLHYECANGSGDHTPNNAPVIVKSCSMPNIAAWTLISGARSPKYLTRRTRSSEDVLVLSMRRKEIIHDVDTEVMQEQERDDDMHKNHKTNFESSYEGFESYSCSASAKEWIVPVSDEMKILQEESQVLNQNESTGKDFKIKRIEDWVNDLQHVGPSEGTSLLSHPDDQVKVEPAVSNVLTAAKVDVKASPGMEAAKRYISSLSASASTAQLANHSLVVIPFLSAFVSLKVLNLSGNAIARITAGALPRGLHMLDLSRNNISTIEGLRELTRLRVLNLSYNRIFRIGHGLASCSSLKELYLAGNKISEVEGLHRLLKLTVLDLRFNKISTAKCLGQLAANYNSLQAISLEGNPAQKNVGDEYLKKHLQGLLPNLVYFNRQAIKVKDAAERSVRLGISNHQIDRGHRSEHRGTRKNNHGTARASSLSHRSQATASPMQSRGRHGRRPLPSGKKATTNNRNHYVDLSSKLLNIKLEVSMRRTQSEGSLGQL
ncbi:Microtubule Associated Stress Protein 1 [Hibiscus trionum]|uniref:Microtubule Associated Stress Protein 1 n=1 Tax=Hibiscus trionum TaxID=183268 RepID=A0A9W7JCR6_HIBTR|nr:Microtubule Associated Stress Protein 1 [Hibiscus trionum]